MQAENSILIEALNGWMESYRIMSDRSDGILRDSIRGFFLNCPWNTKNAVDKTSEQAKALLAVVDAARKLREVEIQEESHPNSLAIRHAVCNVQDALSAYDKIKEHG